MSEYNIKFYINSRNNKKPALDFILSLSQKAQAKISWYLQYLVESNGYLSEPYTRHIIGKVRELRVDFSKQRNRIFYFVFVNKQIILLNGFTKNTQKTPQKYINKAIEYYHDVINNPQLYE